MVLLINSQCYDFRSQKWTTPGVHTQQSRGNMGSFVPDLWVLCATVAKLRSSDGQALASLSYVLDGP